MNHNFTEFYIGKHNRLKSFCIYYLFIAHKVLVCLRISSVLKIQSFKFQFRRLENELCWLQVFLAYFEIRKKLSTIFTFICNLSIPLLRLSYRLLFFYSKVFKRMPKKSNLKRTDIFFALNNFPLSST